MWHYYVKLSWLSIRKTPVLSLLMVLAIATGIASCLTILTLYAVISSNPMAHKNNSLFAVQLDSWGPDEAYPEINGVPPQLTYRDAKALYDGGVADEIVIMTKVGVTVQPTDLSRAASIHRGRMTTCNFFTLFDVRFVYGGSWNDSADIGAEKVVVISEGVNHQLFGGKDSVGKTILLNKEVFTILGVVSDHWRLVPSVYDLNNGAFDVPPEIYFPFFNMAQNEYEWLGNSRSWAPVNRSSHQEVLQSESIWIQVWVGLHTREKYQEFSQYIENYIAQQKQIGRFQRPVKYRFNTPAEWLKIHEVVSDDNRVLLGLSFAFLIICLVNSMVLLLAKFLRKAPEVGIRRALGASRLSIFVQHLTEALVIGMAGAVCGLMLSWLGLIGVRELYSDYDNVAVINGVTVIAALLLALAASFCSGFLPAWRISHAAPARYLKTQ